LCFAVPTSRPWPSALLLLEYILGSVGLDGFVKHLDNVVS